MGSSRTAMGLVATLGALAVVPTALLGAGVSRGAASTCGSLSRGSGASSKDGFLTGTSFVSAGESWAVGSNSSQGTANRTLIERFNGRRGRSSRRRTRAAATTPSTAFP